MFNIKSENDIPGHIFPSQMEHIKQIAASLPEGANVLEIGCAWGRSTWCWLSGLKEGSTLTVVDPFLFGSDGLRIGKHTKRQHRVWQNGVVDSIMRYWQEHGPEKTWKAVVEEHPKKHLIKNLYVGLSQDFALKNNETWDCVYLDGDHKYKSIKADLRNFEPRTNIICGDDYEPETQQGVVRAVTEMIEETGRKFWLDPNSVFWTATKK
jgi:hypothetical protein